MTLRLPSCVSAVLILTGICAAPAIRAAGMVTTCDEPALLNGLAGGGLVTFSCSGTIVLTAPITLLSNTSINGTGQSVTISGGSAVEIFAVLPGVTLTLNNVTVANGYTTLFGGAISNFGTVQVSYSTFSDNTATFLGGAIFNAPTASLTVTTSTFSNNTAPMSGGGAILNDGTATVTASTFVGNSANSGGAIDNDSSATLQVVNSTFYENTASYIGGAILNDGTTTIVNSTFSTNSASFGGGIDNDSGTVTLENSIVSMSTGGNCSGLPFQGAGNLSSDGSCPGIHNENALLGPLQYNGGPTETMALLAGSPAIDAAIEAFCPATDQRGVPRPQGSRCDIGAYERASVPTSGNTCITYYNDTFQGNVNVSNGQNCGFVSGGVTGNVTVSGGNLVLSRATVQGNVQISGGTFFIAPFTYINGDLQIQNIPSGNARNEICGAYIHGNLQFHNNGTAVIIGSAGLPPCPGNTIGNDLQVNNNTAETLLIGNTVGGNLQDHNNTALTEVIHNIVGNDLQCQNNYSIIGGPNTAKQIQDQCY